MAPVNRKRSRLLRGLLLLLASVLFVSIGFGVAGTEKVLHAFRQFPPWVVPAVLTVFALNLAVVSFRLGRLLAHFGVHLPANVASKASVQGHFAALFLISLFGQVAGRHLVLRNHGTPSVFIAALTALERSVLLLVSGSLCLFGAAWLLDGARISAFIGRIPFVQCFAAAALSLAVSLWLGRSRFEVQLLTRLGSKKSAVRFMEIGAITLLAQGLVLSAFVLAGLGLAPDAGLMNLAAAAAITSFAAGLPISVNGWGVRELAAVFAFGQVGVPSSSALAMSILVGLCSTAVVLAAFPLAFGKVDKEAAPQPASSASAPLQAGRLPIEKTGAWVLLVASAILIFFQFHIPLPGGVINLNFADAFALIALAAVVSSSISARTLPVWRVPGFNWMLLVVSVLLLFAFVHGAQTIGVTQWALAGRVIGWLVLLGYLSIGVLVISHLGQRGARRFIETIVVTGCVVVILQATVRWLAYSGWLDAGDIPGNFEGYAGNRNAFAFQMLLCSALLIAYWRHQQVIASRARWYSGASSAVSSHFRLERDTFFALIHGVLLAGLVFSASRAGMLTEVLLLVVAGATGFAQRRTMLLSVMFAIVVWSVFVVVLPWATYFLTGLMDARMSMQGAMSDAASNRERWETIRRGMEMWWDSPLLGAGLGTFIATSSQWFKRAVVIHSTPVWILAEFGLVGAVTLGAAFARILFSACRRGYGVPQGRAVVLLMGVFAVFGTVHEIFFQRIFWLILGACLALPFPPASSRGAS